MSFSEHFFLFLLTLLYIKYNFYKFYSDSVQNDQARKQLLKILTKLKEKKKKNIYIYIYIYIYLFKAIFKEEELPI